MDFTKGRLVQSLFICFICHFLTGCMTLKTTDAPGTQTKIGFGIVKLVSENMESGARRGKVYQIGLWKENHQAGFGFRHTDLISVPEKCHVSFLVTSESEAQKSTAIISELMEKYEGKICLLNPN